MLNTFSRLICMVSLVLTLSGCGLIDYFYLPPPEDTAQELFESGNDAVREHNYVQAIKFYSKLKENFPFSPYAVESELSLADCYYLDEEWGPASDAYKEFESMHPRHESIPYVLFYIGMADLKGYPSIDRPTNQLVEAHSYFQRVRAQYPDTEYAKDAPEKMAECRRLMAEHELYVADFYFRMDRYDSALLRYKEIVRDFTDVPEVHNHAELKAKAAFIKAREQQGERTREKREGSWKDMFNWL